MNVCVCVLRFYRGVINIGEIGWNDSDAEHDCGLACPTNGLSLNSWRRESCGRLFKIMKANEVYSAVHIFYIR
jgi:hypothetical protein